MLKTLWIVCLSLAVFLSAPVSWVKASELLFGVVPQQSATVLAKRWTPFIDTLAKQAGLDIRFVTAKDIPTFEQCLANGAYDIAYMNPYHYVVYSDDPGYQAFAMQTGRKLRGIIVVRADSKLNSLDELGGQNIAFPSPAAFGASVLNQGEMQRKQIKFTPKYVKSHDSVYRSVAAGIFPAGGGVLRTFGNTDETLRNQLRIIHRTGEYTPHAFAFAPHIDQSIRLSIEQAIVSVGAREKDILKTIGFLGIESAGDEQWNDVRSLNLTLGDTKIAINGALPCHSE